MADANRPSPSARVGARIRIKPAHQQEVEALFAEAGVQSLYKEMRSDGNVSYWFGKDQIDELRSTGVVERIPLEFWAHYAVVGCPTTH
ncbi:hypothetical protein GON01_16390 [Sphingomonas sp. MAH-20]|uniref:Uncharacterized protein n=1 Tax=Sphingomonas horti TaxID=2682842 RepID=A0A6I4J422_9SPHN|nr:MULTISPECIES: hypothetical protein [Sphingomonas]MBA2921271.1 hypothetical protein [Sphingomonas sp. CGMCC 1.13658]MVO79512.1 hypothetical protein [Sphingomonas horti]